jgi:hypothetical protein
METILLVVHDHIIKAMGQQKVTALSSLSFCLIPLIILCFFIVFHPGLALLVDLLLYLGLNFTSLIGILRLMFIILFPVLSCVPQGSAPYLLLFTPLSSLSSDSSVLVVFTVRSTATCFAVILLTLFCMFCINIYFRAYIIFTNETIETRLLHT